MNFRNHEQGLAAQKTYQKQVNSLFETFKRMGNPELVTPDSRNCVNESVAISLHTMENLGTKQYREFVTNRIALLLFINQSRRILLLSTSDLN